MTKVFVTVVIILASLGCVSCGGGSASSSPPPPPPPPPPSVPVISAFRAAPSAGAAPLRVTFSWTISDPSGTPLTCRLDVDGNGSFEYVIGNCTSSSTQEHTYASTGNFSARLRVENSQSQAERTLAVSVAAAFTNRTAYVRLDSTPTSPVGAQLPSKLIAYDARRKQIYVANSFLNRVEVCSTQDRRCTGFVSIPWPTSVDLSPDGSSVYVGTGTMFFYIVDRERGEIRAKVLGPLDFGLPLNPLSVLATANGTVLVRAAGGPITSSAAIYQWDPATGTYRARADLPPMHAAGIFRRSGDHSKILIASDDSGGNLALYESSSDRFIASARFYGGITRSLALNSDGSRIAVVSSAGALALYDGQLNELLRKDVGFSRGAIFSHDGQFLYVFRHVDVFVPVVEVYSITDLSLVGRVSDLWLNGGSANVPQDVDETGLVFALGERGLSFLDAAMPGSLPQNGPAVTFLSVTSGRLNTSVPTNMPVQNSSPVSRVFFGTSEAPGPTLANSQIQTAAPPSSTPGPVGFRAVFENGWLGIAPEAFSYGPAVIYQPVSGGPSDGGVDGFVIGYGIGQDPSAIQVQVGNAAATNIQTRSGAGIIPFPFPMERMKFRLPAATPGVYDVTITTPSGTTTLPKAIRYFQQTRVQLAGEFFESLLDKRRGRLYLTDRGRIQVVSANSLQPLPPIPVPVTNPNTRLTGMALLPDGSRLVVVDTGSPYFFSIDPDNPADARIYDVTLPLDSALGLRPFQVAPTSTGKVFVNMTFAGSGCVQSLIREVDLVTGSVVARTDQSQSPCLAHMAGTPDGRAVYWNMDGVGIFWDAATDTFLIRSVNILGGKALTVAADGNRVAYGLFLADGRIQFENVAFYVDVDVLDFGLAPGLELHPSGSLFYVPGEFGVEVVDANTGRLLQRLIIPDAIGALRDAITVDETGGRIYLITTTGLTLLELDVPLTIGSVRPGQADAGGGAQATVRGSGFQPGAVVQFGTANAATTFVDANTLQVTVPPGARGPARITLRNPDGSSYSLDAAFVYQ